MANIKVKVIRISSLLLISLIGYSCESTGPNAEGSKFKEIEQLWSTVPIYTGMKEVNSSSNSSPDKAHISKGYNLDAPYEDVKRFYMEKLLQDDWQLIEDRKMSDWGRDLGGQYIAFRKGEYKLSIQYAGEKANYGWDCGFFIGWPDP